MQDQNNPDRANKMQRPWGWWVTDLFMEQPGSLHICIVVREKERRWLGQVRELQLKQMRAMLNLEFYSLFIMYILWTYTLTFIIATIFFLFCCYFIFFLDLICKALFISYTYMTWDYYIDFIFMIVFINILKFKILSVLFP